MIYTAWINYWDEYEAKERDVNMFVCAESFQGVMKEIAKYFGEDMLNHVEIKPYSPDNMIIFDGETGTKETDVFYYVYDVMGAKVIW